VPVDDGYYLVNSTRTVYTVGPGNSLFRRRVDAEVRGGPVGGGDDRPDRS